MRSRSKEADLKFLFDRLAEVRMSEYELVRARAHLERAEAVADGLVAAGRAIARLYRKLVARPIRRIAASIG